MQRDFTYVDDIVEGVIRVSTAMLRSTPEYDPISADPATSNAPYRVFNIGNNNPVQLLDFIGAIENALGQKAEKRLLPLQDGDVPATYANTDLLNDWVGFVPAPASRTASAASSPGIAITTRFKDHHVRHRRGSSRQEHRSRPRRGPEETRIPRL
jgi:nucleoside-diphosphate-sugar epimerase